MRKLAHLGFVLLLGLAPGLASAATFSALGGYSLGSGPGYAGVERGSVLLGGEVTFGVGDTLQLGAFYDQNFLNLQNTLNVGGVVTTTATQRFLGGVVRIGLPLVGLFADGKAGAAQTAVGGTTYDSALGLGVGAGYRFGLAPFMDLSPRLGVRWLPLKSGGTTQSQTFIDLGIMFSIGF